jgi:guanylate kinase
VKMGKRGKLLIFAAPSGTGKSTIVGFLMQQGLNTHFSISTTTRAPRGNEQHGKEYFFITPEEFREHIQRNDFVEYEEVYTDRFYGTLKSQVENQLNEGQNVVFDVDVNGGMNIKKSYGDQALSIFIMPPSIDELRLRLTNRGTDAPEVIEQRIARAEYEISQAENFDKTVVNDNLQTAEEEVLALVKEFLNSEAE